MRNKQNTWVTLPRAVLFDMDGVITDTMFYHYLSWHKVLYAEGINITKHEIYQREGQRGIVSIREIFSKYDRTFSLIQGQDILSKKEKLFKKIVRTRFITGARSFIKMLARKGIQLALVTGTSRDEVCKIIPETVLSSFSVIISGTDVKNGKPHPEPYLKALKGLKLLKLKGEAVVIENAPLGIRSAKAAGLQCFAIATSLSKRYLRGADRVFNNFASFEKFFRIRYRL